MHSINIYNAIINGTSYRNYPRVRSIEWGNKETRVSRIKSRVAYTLAESFLLNDVDISSTLVCNMLSIVGVFFSMRFIHSF